jgi:hypothetical protein
VELHPSRQIWDYFKGDITPLHVVSAVADVNAGYHISYSARELLKDLKMLSPMGKVNRKARLAVAHYLHAKHHKSIEDLTVVQPEI